MNRPRSPIRLSRRRLMAVSGATLAAGSTAVLAACGAAEEDERSPEHDVELLNRILASQLALREGANQAKDGPPAPLAEAIFDLRDETDSSIAKLNAAISDLDGSPTETADHVDTGAESAVEGVHDQLDAEIKLAIQAVADFSTPELVQTVYGIVFTDAAYLAVIRETLGDEIAPDAFVGLAGSQAGS